MFTVHRLDDKVFYEIPEAELGREFLWVSQIARTTEGVGHGGQALGNRVVKWERHGDRILLKGVSYALVADAERPIARAVEAANNDTIIRAFDIEALSEAGAPVIDVTTLFSREVPEFSARSRLQARGFARDRSFVESVTAFPENIEVKTTHTYTVPPPSSSQNRSRTPSRRRGMRPGSATVLLHYSMVKLPENPMQPRLFDERVGYFSVRQIDYGRDEHRSPRRRYITRWRLEKQDPDAAVSDPVKPITYWIDPATPTRWVPYIKQGVEAWRPAFEAAGFSNAIVAREAPTPDEDPDWSPEDARYSVIRWAAVDGPERLRTARPRPAHRRDPGDRHPVPPQRHEPGARLVLRAGRSARPPGADPAAAGRTDGRAAGLRGGARGGTYARLPAQHEGQLALPAREGARSRLGPHDEPHAHADGLLAGSTTWRSPRTASRSRT